MTRILQAQVLIVGAGPVGLSLATDLAQRGISVLVAETRQRGEPPQVKCNHVSARSMEIFRRLGVARALRDAGLPADYPNDVAYRTTFTGEELSRIPIPCRRDRYTATGGPDTWWPTPEPPHRINQIYLEPILFAHAEATPGVRILNRTRIDDFTQDIDGVRATGVDLDTGETVPIRCEYLVGCDGGRSGVRKKIGAKLSGTDVVGRVQSTFFRAPDLLGRAKSPPAWATFSLNPRRSGNVYAIDGRETFLLHNYLKADETDFESVDRDWAIRTILGVGADFRYEIISKEDWIGRRLVADRFRDRRVFLCGDASHLWIPMAGYGMNAGIADAMDLSWQLAGRLRGWREWLSSVISRPELLREATPVCGAWQLRFLVWNFTPALQKVMVEQQQPDGSWAVLHGRFTIEFRAAAARPRTPLRREFTVPIDSASAKLRLAVRGIGQVRLGQVELTDGVTRLRPRHWPSAVRKLLGRPAPQRGFPELDLQVNQDELPLAFPPPPAS